jgi:transcriptional regulator with XRE-family HTH domain
VIGRSLINLPRTLTGDEFRFLRVELDWSYRRLARKLGANERSIAKWERARDRPVVNRSAERILRQLYNDHIDGDPKFRELIVEMADLDAGIAPFELRIELDEQSDKWKPAA